MNIKYDKFDKELSPREVRNKILKLLEERPMQRKTIIELVKASDTKVEHQIVRLMREGEVDKQFIEGTWYYGLTKEYREQIKLNKKVKINE